MAIAGQRDVLAVAIVLAARIQLHRMRCHRIGPLSIPWVLIEDIAAAAEAAALAVSQEDEHHRGDQVLLAGVWVVSLKEKDFLAVDVDLEEVPCRPSVRHKPLLYHDIGNSSSEVVSVVSICRNERIGERGVKI